MDPDSEKTDLINPDQQSTCPPTCPAVVYQQVSVSVPVRVHPFAKEDEITVTCCEDPIITPGNKCPGKENGHCSYVVTQKICVSIPIEFGAKACVGDPFIHCGEPSTEDSCGDCNTTVNSPTDNIPFGLKILTQILKFALKGH